MSDENYLLKKLREAIMEADFDGAPQIAKEALRAGIPAEMLMQDGIVEGMRELEEKLFGGCKAWGHPLLFMGAEAARRALELIEPLFIPQRETIGTVVLGTPAGDVHDIGGKMVALALIAAGFKVIYLGRDVPSSLFVHKVKESGAQILAISTYQTTGFNRIQEIMGLVGESGLTDKVKIMVGGPCVTEKYAEKFKLGYGKHASDAVQLARQYVGR